jgi:hypothetical protein
MRKVIERLSESTVPRPFCHSRESGNPTLPPHLDSVSSTEWQFSDSLFDFFKISP